MFFATGFLNLSFDELELNNSSRALPSVPCDLHQDLQCSRLQLRAPIILFPLPEPFTWNPTPHSSICTQVRRYASETKLFLSALKSSEVLLVQLFSPLFHSILSFHFNLVFSCHTLFLVHFPRSFFTMSNYNLGPLTTTFTPAPTCTVPVIACATCNYCWAAQTCFSGGVEDYTACWPGTSSGVPAPTPPLQGWGFYSPGLVCPQGYASACGAVETAAGTWTPQFPLQTGETAVGCCPR